MTVHEDEDRQMHLKTLIAVLVGLYCCQLGCSLTEYRREVAASSIAFRPTSESSSGLLRPLSPPSPFSHSNSPFIRYSILIGKTGNALVTRPGLQVSTGGGDHLLFETPTAVKAAGARGNLFTFRVLFSNILEGLILKIDDLFSIHVILAGPADVVPPFPICDVLAIVPVCPRLRSR
ncbi:hypothetical protein EVAR_25380_1 [Eumeta japonica]|uniref:Uncharacterized protein n=1 Tax=Eumeta variegata TaxID=151549 RepID=A0A4C1V5B1_EUMVA|nr:hypothetical protein EVAR_25380_1 [Eumeta japonica]